MRDGRRSRTAEATALMRAAHRILDDQPLVLDDPWAARLLPAHLGIWLRSAPALRRSVERRLARSFTRARSTHRIPFGSRRIRAQVVVRSRYAEDCLEEAIAAGVDQCVLLAAGLDSLALRRADLAGRVRIFEVDHPATQSWKRRRLEQLRAPLPESLAFVPCDFERQTLAQALARSDFDPARSAFVSWLGVCYYLTAPAIRETLAFVASLGSGSFLVLDYWCEQGLLRSSDRALLEAIRTSVATQGEPMHSFFTASDLREEAEAVGLALAADLSAEETQRLYLGERRDGLVVPEFARLARLEMQ